MVEFNLPVAGGVFVALIAVGVGVLIATPMGDGMGTDTILTMVAPSMAAFGLLCLAIGVKHGEYRASTAR